MIGSNLRRILLCLICCGLFCCTKSSSNDSGGGGGGGSGSGQLRFINLIPELKTVYVYTDTDPDPITLEYGVPTEYKDFGNESVEIRVLVASSPLALVDQSYSLKSDSDKTLVLFGDPNPKPPNYNISAKLLEDSHEPSIENRFDLRVIDAYPKSKGFDVFVTLPGVSLDNVLPFIKGIGFKGKDQYFSGNESTGIVTFYTSKDKETLFATSLLDLAAHPVITLYYAPDLPGGQGVLVSYDSDL